MAELIDALRNADMNQQTSMGPGGSFRRVGTDIVDLRDLEHQEMENLTFAKELRGSTSNQQALFYGSSSNAPLIKKALEYKTAFTGRSTPTPSAHSQRTQEWEESYTVSQKNCRGNVIDKFRLQRDPGTEELLYLNYSFPVSDLLDSLIDIYFRESNSVYPILHRPTFTRLISEGLHHTDRGFAKVVLLVSAVAARWSNDPRVLYSEADRWHSAGWQWYNQVQAMDQVHLATPTLYDLQYYFVSGF
jgi:hypothetical protein